MKYCENCGARLDDHDMFCPECGRIQEDTNTGQVVDTPLGEYPQNQSGSPGKSEKKTFVIVLVLIIIVAAAAAGFYFLGKNRDSNNEGESVESGTAEDVSDESELLIDESKLENSDTEYVEEYVQPEENSETEKKSLSPFSEIAVFFTGENGSGKLEISGLASEGPMSGYFFEWDNDGHLKNGDKVILTYNTEKLQQLFPEYEVQDTQREYIVNGLKEKETPTEDAEQEMETETAESAKAEANAYLMSYEPDLKGCKYLKPASAFATSTIDQSDIGVINDVSLLFDLKDETSWQEGVDGYGIGEYVSFLFDSEREVRYMGFKLGNWKNMDLYNENARPKTVLITIGDFQKKITFTGEIKIEWIAFENVEPASEITIQIKDVFTGTKYDDTCIAEIMIYGR